MNTKQKKAALFMRLFAGAIGLGLTMPLVAAPTLNGFFDMGGEYDSNVGVKELDQLSRESDWAATASAGATLDWTISPGLTFSAGAQYDHKHYRTFSAYDQAGVRGHVDMSYRFSPLTVGLNHHAVVVQLDREPFLTLSRFGLYAGKMLTSHLYLRAQVSQQAKSIASQPARDAEGLGWSLESYWFSDDASRYWTAAIAVEDEQANRHDYSNQALSVRLGWSNQFSLLNKNSQLQLQWRYLDRGYDGPGISPEVTSLGQSALNPSQAAMPTPANRSDLVQQWEAKWRLSVNDVLSLGSQLVYADHRSNLATADYTETTASVTARLSF